MRNRKQTPEAQVLVMFRSLNLSQLTYLAIENKIRTFPRVNPKGTRIMDCTATHSTSA